MKILLFGAVGQVGWELRRSLTLLGELCALGRVDLDLDDKNLVVSKIGSFSPDIIVNAAAYTAVDKAEENYDKAFYINAEIVKTIANEAKKIDALLIHYSTDYVFDGEKKTPYLETDKPDPKSVYGQSKLAGEELLEGSGCRYIIFRTSWVYSTYGKNFIKTILNHAWKGSTLRIVDDQIGVPTSAELIADVTSAFLHQLIITGLVHEPIKEIYHLTPLGKISWYSLAYYILTVSEGYGLTFKTMASDIVPIETGEYPSLAERPKNSCLDSKKIQSHLKLKLPKWEIHVDRILYELSQRNKRE